MRFEVAATWDPMEAASMSSTSSRWLRFSVSLWNCFTTRQTTRPRLWPTEWSGGEASRDHTLLDVMDDETAARFELLKIELANVESGDPWLRFERPRVGA
jgi:hypothetical protein